jgi:DNA-binding CsgD family transcriptional regulator
MIGPPEAPPRFWEGRLTPAQARVVEMVRWNMTYEQMGAILGVAGATVKHHLTNAYGRLEVSDRVQAAVWWVEHVENPERDENFRELISKMRSEVAELRAELRARIAATDETDRRAA